MRGRISSVDQRLSEPPLRTALAGTRLLLDGDVAAGINAAAIHGNKSQGARTKALADFKNGTVRILVATDIAARGLDIDQLPQVVNFDLPNVSEDYVHRIGRTGRAGATGQAVSLVSADEFDMLAGIERLIKQVLPRKEIEQFEPVHLLPESRPGGRAPRPQNVNRPRSAPRTGQPRGNAGGGRPATEGRGRSGAAPSRSRRQSP